MLRRAPAVLSRRLMNGIFILPPGEAKPIKVSSPGETIWTLLEEWQTVDELVDDLAVLHSTPVDIVRRDVEPLLGELYALGMLEARPGPGSPVS